VLQWKKKILMKKIIFNFLCSWTTQCNDVLQTVSVIDDTVVLSNNGTTVELRRMDKNYSLVMHQREFEDAVSRKLYEKTVHNIVGFFSHNRDLEKFFEDSRIVFCMSHGKKYLIQYDISRGFFETGEQTWHVDDLIRMKTRDLCAWRNEYYLPVLM